MAHHARDAAELAELLEMVGLSAEEGKRVPSERPLTTESAVEGTEPARRLTPEEVRALASTLLASYSDASR
jgi:hypothetical protein